MWEEMMKFTKKDILFLIFVVVALIVAFAVLINWQLPNFTLNEAEPSPTPNAEFVFGLNVFTPL